MSHHSYIPRDPVDAHCTYDTEMWCLLPVLTWGSVPSGLRISPTPVARAFRMWSWVGAVPYPRMRIILVPPRPTGPGPGPGPGPWSPSEAPGSGALTTETWPWSGSGWRHRNGIDTESRIRMFKTYFTDSDQLLYLPINLISHLHQPQHIVY